MRVSSRSAVGHRIEAVAAVLAIGRRRLRRDREIRKRQCEGKGKQAHVSLKPGVPSADQVPAKSPHSTCRVPAISLFANTAEFVFTAV